MAAWTHLVRFIAEEDAQIHFGNVDASKYPDVGLSLFKGEKVAANLINGSAFSGTVTEKVVHIKQVSHYHSSFKYLLMMALFGYVLTPQEAPLTSCRK